MQQVIWRPNLLVCILIGCKSHPAQAPQGPPQAPQGDDPGPEEPLLPRGPQAFAPSALATMAPKGKGSKKPKEQQELAQPSLALPKGAASASGSQATEDTRAGMAAKKQGRLPPPS